jgi:hypothetical protein
VPKVFCHNIQSTHSFAMPNHSKCSGCRQCFVNGDLTNHLVGIGRVHRKCLSPAQICSANSPHLGTDRVADIAPRRATENGEERRLCRHFARGFCKFGNQCHFSHDRTACTHFAQGSCMRGSTCWYIHDQSPSQLHHPRAQQPTDCAEVLPRSPYVPSSAGVRLTTWDRTATVHDEMELSLSQVEAQSDSSSRHRERLRLPPRTSPAAVITSNGSPTSTDSSDLDELCVVCMDRHSSILLSPCGHCCLCGECSEEMVAYSMRLCPVCRGDVKSRAIFLY